MVQKNLIKYIKKCKQQGYNLSTIKSMLHKAGYSQYDINTAITQSQKPEKIITTKTLAIGFAAIIILIIIVIILMKIMAAPTELELSLKPFKTELMPGEQLIITAQIQNIGEKKTKTMIDAFIIGPDGKEQIPSKSITLKDKARVPIKTTIKTTATPGTYTLTVFLSYNGQIKTKSLQFLVREKTKPVTESPAFITKEEETKQELLECPKGCDDLDRCTKDECINGKCVHTPIIPCCGNNFCEPGENVNNCPQDCKEKPKITTTAKHCQELTNKKEADNCFKEIAKKTDNKENCQYILNSEIRDVCYMNFAYKKDFSVCDKITNKYTRNTCYTLQSLTEVEQKTKSS